MLKKFIGTSVVISMLLSLMFLVSACSNLPPDAAATVNGKVITRDEVAERIRVGAGINPSKTPSNPESEEYKLFQRDMTEQMVSEEVEKQEAEKRGITVTAEEVDAIIDQVIEDKYLGSLEKLREDFARRGVKEDDLRQQIVRQLLHQKILASLRDEVAVTEDEARARYEADKGNYVTQEKRQVRQVVVPDEAAASAIHDRIAGGEDMPVIAGQSSIDTKTKTNGGLVGLVTRSQLSKAVGDVAFALQANEVSAPFKAELGWYVIRVEIVVAATNRTFDEVKDELIMHLSNQNLTERYKTYTEEIKGDYDIEYADDYSPREAQPIGPSTTQDPAAVQTVGTVTTP